MSQKTFQLFRFEEESYKRKRKNVRLYFCPGLAVIVIFEKKTDTEEDW